MKNEAYYALDSLDGSPRVVMAVRSGGFYHHRDIITRVYESMEEARAAANHANAHLLNLSGEEAEDVVLDSMFPNRKK